MSKFESHTTHITANASVPAGMISLPKTLHDQIGNPSEIGVVRLPVIGEQSYKTLPVKVDNNRDSHPQIAFDAATSLGLDTDRLGDTVMLTDPEDFTE